MATRLISKALSAAALGIALSLLLAATTTASPAWSNTAGALQLDPPAAPSHCTARTRTVRDHNGNSYNYITVSWRDNSSNEDGFTVECWSRTNANTEWVWYDVRNVAANRTEVSFGGIGGSNYRFRVKASNASGDSAWSNWTR